MWPLGAAKECNYKSMLFQCQYEGCFTTKQWKTLPVEDLGVIVRFRFVLLLTA